MLIEIERLVQFVSVAENFDVFAVNQRHREPKKHRKRLILSLFMLCECVRLIKNDEAKAEDEEKHKFKGG